MPSLGKNSDTRHPFLFPEAEISPPTEEQNMCNATFVMLQVFNVIYHILAAFIKIFLFGMKRNNENTEII